MFPFLVHAGKLSWAGQLTVIVGVPPMAFGEPRIHMGVSKLRRVICIRGFPIIPITIGGWPILIRVSLDWSHTVVRIIRRLEGMVLFLRGRLYLILRLFI